MADRPLEPRLSRLNNAFLAMTQESSGERKKPDRLVNIRQQITQNDSHSSMFASFSASQSPLVDYDDGASSPWTVQHNRRQPSISFTDEHYGDQKPNSSFPPQYDQKPNSPLPPQYGGHHRDLSYDHMNYDPQRHRGISIASSHASFMAERFDNGRGRNFSAAGSEMFDDSERSMPNVQFASSNQLIGSPQSFGLATDAFGRFPSEPISSFEKRDHDRKLWTGLELRLKSLNEKAFDLMTFKSEMEMIMDGSDTGHNSRFANLAHVLKKRVTPAPYDDSKPLVEQTMNMVVPDDLMYVVETLDRDPQSITKHQLITLRRRLYDHAANNHNHKSDIRAQGAMLEKMTELAKDIEQDLKEYGNASSMLVNRLLSDLEQEELNQQEFQKKAEAVKHFQRQTINLQDKVSTLETALQNAETAYVISDSEETPTPDYIPQSSGAKKQLEPPRPTHGRYQTQDLEDLKEELEKEHQKDVLVLHDRMSELIEMNQEKHDEQSVLEAKLKKKEQSVAELERACQELTMNLDTYKSRVIEQMQEINEQKEQLDMARSQFQRLESQIASRVLPREFKPISLESELDMMKYIDNSESVLKSPHTSGPGSIQNHFSDQSTTSNMTATENTEHQVEFFQVRDSRSVSILTDNSRPDEIPYYHHLENDANPTPPPTQTHAIPPQSLAKHSTSPQPAKAASVEPEIPGMIKQDTSRFLPGSYSEDSSLVLPTVVLNDPPSSSNPQGLDPDSDPSRNVSSPNTMIFQSTAPIIQSYFTLPSLTTEHNEFEQEYGEGGHTAGAMGVNAGDTDNGAIDDVSNPGAPQKPFKLSSLGMNSLQSEEIMSGWDSGTYEERRGTDRSRVPMDRMGSHDENERMKAYRSTNNMRHRITRDKSNISVTAPPQEHQVFELRNRVAELERDLKDTKHYLSFAYETIRILETEKRRRNMVPQQVTRDLNLAWEEEKKEYLNVISRIEADNDNLKYQLDKTKKQYRKLLKRVPHSVTFSNEVSVVLSLLALTLPAANRGQPRVLPQATKCITRTEECSEILLGIQQSGPVDT